MRGGPFGIARGEIKEKNEKSELSAIVTVTAPYKYLPSKPLFWWIIVPVTICLWLLSLIGIVFESYNPFVEYIFPISMFSAYM